MTDRETIVDAINNEIDYRTTLVANATGHQRDTNTLFNLADTFALQALTQDNTTSIAASYALALTRIIDLNHQIHERDYIIDSFDILEHL